MGLFLKIILFLMIFHMSIIEKVQGEPWLSNRFANNCAACHAPGRLNRKAKERRCTLSCQGCHVNPNGGGLRNQYGQWNSERFLKSFKSDITWNKALPAPFEKQRYAKENLSPRKIKRYVRKGAILVESEKGTYDSGDYQDTKNYKIIAKNVDEEKLFIPADDPYRRERSIPLYATGDFRFFALKLDGDGLRESQKKTVLWPMVFDLGIRLLPFRSPKFSFVYESRIFNSNREASPDLLFGTRGNAGTRSAYVLYGDLPYNSYIQAGYFRPLFGISNPNHTTLFSEFTGLNQNSKFKAIGVGTAPNVPFLIFNILQKSDAQDSASEEGFVLTGGLRGVTLGWSAVASYWSTQSENSVDNSKKLMFNFNGGLSFWGFTTNIDYTFIETAQFQVEPLKGSIITLEAKYRLWRELYLQFNNSTADAALLSNVLGGPGLTDGSADESAMGIKFFPLAGSEIDVLYQARVNREARGGETSYKMISLQWHLYF